MATSVVLLSLKSQPLLQPRQSASVVHDKLILLPLAHLLLTQIPVHSASTAQNWPFLAPPSQVFTLDNPLFSKLGQRSVGRQNPVLGRAAPAVARLLDGVQKPPLQVPTGQAPVMVLHVPPPGQSATALHGCPFWLPPVQILPHAASLAQD